MSLRLARPWGRTLAALLLAAGPARAALADVVTTTDGKTYEGKVVSESDAAVVVETTFDGRKEVPRALVAKVDKTVPPLREQFAYRLGEAKDVPALLDLAAWAKGKGFRAEVEAVWLKVLTVDPANVKAHRALGHVRSGDKWLTPEEKAAADRAAEEAAQRAKGLVRYQGRWVTPQEKEALEKGLLRDGDEWVTEDEYHRRRGEAKVDGAWVRVGEAEGKARAAALAKAVDLPLVALWGPHVDLYHELAPAEGQAVLDAAERTVAAFHRLMKPGPDDRLEGLRIEVVCAQKAAGYARYVQRFAQESGITRMTGFESWPTQASRMTSFYWTDPRAVCGAYLFPNTVPVLQSLVSHDVALILLNRYKFNFRFSHPWLAEGLAYHLEIEANGKTSSFTVGRSGIPGGGDPAPWQDSTKWRELLKAQALAGQDTPFPRLAGLSADGLGLCDLAKSWSVVDFLVRLDRAKWKAFVDGSKDRERTEEEALTAAYGMDARAVETRWRQAVTGEAKSP